MTTLLRFWRTQSWTAARSAVASAVKIDRLSGRRLLYVVAMCCRQRKPYLVFLFWTVCVREIWKFCCGVVTCIHCTYLAKILVGVMSALLSLKRYYICGCECSQKGFSLGRGTVSGITSCNLERDSPNCSESGGVCKLVSVGIKDSRSGLKHSCIGWFGVYVDGVSAKMLNSSLLTCLYAEFVSPDMFVCWRQLVVPCCLC